MPLAETYTAPPSELSEAQLETLPKLLNTQLGHDAFRRFLQLEFATENLYFWKEVNAYRDLCSSALQAATHSDELAAKALKKILKMTAFIYHLYVHPGAATHEINIPAQILKEIQQTLVYDFLSLSLHTFASHSHTITL